MNVINAIEAYVSLLSAVIEQPPDIVRGWLNAYYVLRKIAERSDDDIISDGEGNDHA